MIRTHTRITTMALERDVIKHRLILQPNQLSQRRDFKSRQSAVYSSSQRSMDAVLDREEPIAPPRRAGSTARPSIFQHETDGKQRYPRISTTTGCI